jgi:hypothetical protein
MCFGALLGRLRLCRIMLISVVRERSREVISFLLVRRHAQALFQVGAGTEGIVALAREDQCSCATLAILLVQTLDDTVQLAQQLLRNGIAGLGTVKRQHRDGTRVWSRDARDLEGSAE